MLAIKDTQQVGTSLTVAQMITNAKEWDTTKLKGLVHDLRLQLIKVISTPSIHSSTPSTKVYQEMVSLPAIHSMGAQGLDVKYSPSWEFSWIWNLDVIPKLQIFLWMSCIIPYKGHSSKKMTTNWPICPFFNNDIEDVEHLCLRCQSMQDVWKLARNHNWVFVNVPQSCVPSIQNWLSNLR